MIRRGSILFVWCFFTLFLLLFRPIFQCFRSASTGAALENVKQSGGK